MRHFRQRALIPWLLAIVLSSGFLGYAMASQAKSPVSAVNTTNGLGLKGYDPVAYFTTGHPTPGVDAYTYHWKGVTYRFASAESQERFQVDPEQYLPQYGGECAYPTSLHPPPPIRPARRANV